MRAINEITGDIIGGAMSGHELDFCPFEGRFFGLAPRRSAAHAAGAKAASNTACNGRGRFRNTSV